VNRLANNKLLVCALISAALLVITGIFNVYMIVRAGTIQTRARDLDRAVIAAQSAVADYKIHLGAGTPSVIYFDKDFNIIDKREEDGFMLTVDVTVNDAGLNELRVTVTKNTPYILEASEKSTIFTLNTAVYTGVGD
jgi:hypothetical protein